MEQNDVLFSQGEYQASENLQFFLQALLSPQFSNVDRIIWCQNDPSKWDTNDPKILVDIPNVTVSRLIPIFKDNTSVKNDLTPEKFDCKV